MSDTKTIFEKVEYEIGELLSENYPDKIYAHPINSIQNFTLGKSILARKKQYGIIFDWVRGKITSINKNGTYEIFFLDKEVQNGIIAEHIRLFDTTKIYLPPNPDFSFITDQSTRNMIKTGYDGVMLTEGWDMIREFTGRCFMFTSNPNIKRIMNAVNDKYNGGHSGCSIGYTMRILERISHVGMNIFKKEWENNK
jgi:hypothetical protein